VSDFRAIAHVTEALRLKLSPAVKEAVKNADAFVGRPDQAKPPCVNVFLYHVAPNAALRNDDVPTRDSGGAFVQRPRAALELDFLLTMHGAEADLEPQKMLGAVIRTLHAAPVLNRTIIEQALGDQGDDQAPLFHSNLLEATEAIRFTHLPLTFDDLSKLWSMFGDTKYVLAVAYQASPVIVEGAEEPPAPLPVRSRNVVVVPAPGPVIERLAARGTAPGAPLVDQPIHAGDTLHVIGRSLAGARTKLRIAGELVEPASVTGTLVTIPLAVPPLPDLRAGLVTVQVVHEIDFSGSPTQLAFDSNTVPFALAPVITPAVDGTNLKIDAVPIIRKDQRLMAVLNATDPAAPASFRIPLTATADGTQTFPLTGVPSAEYFVRLQIDGAESAFDVDAAGHVTGPKVNT